MTITINVTADSPIEIREILLGLAGGAPPAPVNPTVAPAATSASGTPPAATPAPVPISAPPAAPVQTLVVPVAPAPTYSLEQITAAGSALIDAGKMTELVGLLGTFGVQSVQQLQPDQLGAFATRLREMGAQI